MKLLPLIKENLNYWSFKLYVNDKEILHKLDNKVQGYDDLANKMAFKLWLEALPAQPDKDGDNSINTLTGYMNSAPGFTYGIALDTTELATGMVRMTATMRFKR